MISCQNCRTLIELMKNQISELTEKENQLRRINNTLTDALSQNAVENHFEQAQHWKIKYEDEVKRSHELEKQVLQQLMVNTNINYKLFPQALKSKSSKLNERRGAENMFHSSSNFYENEKHKSISKMDNLMNTILMKKELVGHPKSRKNSTHRTHGSQQVILRIIDDRASQIS